MINIEISVNKPVYYRLKYAIARLKISARGLIVSHLAPVLRKKLKKLSKTVTGLLLMHSFLISKGKRSKADMVHSQRAKTTSENFNG